MGVQKGRHGTTDKKKRCLFFKRAFALKHRHVTFKTKKLLLVATNNQFADKIRRRNKYMPCQAMTLSTILEECNLRIFSNQNVEDI